MQIEIIKLHLSEKKIPWWHTCNNPTKLEKKELKYEVVIYYSKTVKLIFGGVQLYIHYIVHYQHLEVFKIL